MPPCLATTPIIPKPTHWIIVLSCVLHACRSTLPQKSQQATPLTPPLTFEYLQLSATLRYQDQQHQHSNAHIRIRIQKDTIIWFSVTNPLGIEVVRGTITPQGIALLNHPQKVYHTYTYATLSNHWNYHISYAWIQAVLLGETMLPLKPQEIIYQGPDKTVLQQQQHPWILTHIMNPTHGQQEKLVALDMLTQRQCIVTYQPSARSHHFRQVHIHLYRQAQSEINLTLKRIRTRQPSKPLKFPLKIPPTYAKK